MFKIKTYPTPSKQQVLAARTARGLTQDQTAALLQISRRTLVAYERGESQMHPLIWDWFVSNVPVTLQVLS